MPLPTSDHLQLAVLVSGGGTNFQAILDAIDDGALHVDVRVCVGSRPDARALERARGRGIPVQVLQPPGSAEDPAAELLSIFEAHGVNFIALAGFMRFVPEKVIERFRNRILNIHPALLPAFGGKGMYGRKVHEAVIAYGVRWSGATVHLVDETYDTGPIVLQEPVPVLQTDTPEDLAGRVLAVEHHLYPLALRLFDEGRVTVQGRRVVIEQRPADFESKPND